MAELAEASIPAMKMRVHRARESLREALVLAGYEGDA
jgi:DNA-directed RNA polymerase specialized sigma24 family protein